MQFAGQAIRVNEREAGVVEICFDRDGESVNTLNQHCLQELREVIGQLGARTDLNGVIFSSAKESFIVGADITEFMGLFNREEEEIVSGLTEMNQIFNALEDLPCPTVAAVNGQALGGGFELCLACDFRVVSPDARVGLPEVKLGIYPGWGGTVRLPRLIGVDNALEWICTGGEKKAEVALKEGAVDAVVERELLVTAALDLLCQVQTGKLDHIKRRAQKQSPLQLPPLEQMMVFESARGLVGAKAGPHYPAPMKAIDTVQKAASKGRDQALEVEAKGFAKLARNPVTESLVGLFIKDQQLKKKARQLEAQAKPVKQAAVLGAGIMGGGIAYQAASKGVPIQMKDIAPEALALGLAEADKLLLGGVARGKLTPESMAQCLNRIHATLSYGDFRAVDLVVEAVVENPKIKTQVLAEVEAQLDAHAVLTSNTSTISITELAKGLARPENFCGMHFFNPVHRMPLVEVIRGEKTSDETIATVVAFARTLGKTPVVVNDCPGFLVNRVLFPYFAGFSQLLRDGADFRQVDRVMEKFGWPMGPAYLLDVVGLDTACHADGVMAAGFPDRMGHEGVSPIEHLHQAKRLGQKNGKGFYAYEPDRKGKPKKVVDEAVVELLKPVVAAPAAFTDEEIIERMMIPLCIETVRCLEEGIVATPAEADMGLIYGIGFPPFRGGALHYLDTLGLAQFCERAAAYAKLGPLYQPTEQMQAMASAGRRYYQQ